MRKKKRSMYNRTIVTIPNQVNTTEIIPPASPKIESTEKTKVSNKESVETLLPQLTQDLVDVRKELKELTDRTMMIQEQINQLNK